MPRRKLDFVSHVCLFKHWNYWVGFWKDVYFAYLIYRLITAVMQWEAGYTLDRPPIHQRANAQLFSSICGASRFCDFAECTASALQTNQLCSLNNKNIIIRGTKCSYLEWLSKNPCHYKEDFRYKLFLKSFSEDFQFQVNL